MIVNDNSSIISKWSSKRIDDARVIIYDRNMFIIQVTGIYQMITGEISIRAVSTWSNDFALYSPSKLVAVYSDHFIEQTLWGKWETWPLKKIPYDA